jgi:hypothetical protein
MRQNEATIGMDWPMVTTTVLRFGGGIEEGVYTLFDEKGSRDRGGCDKKLFGGVGTVPLLIVATGTGAGCWK